MFPEERKKMSSAYSIVMNNKTWNDSLVLDDRVD